MPTLTPHQDTVAGIKIELYETDLGPTISFESAQPHIDCEIIYNNPTAAEQAYAEIKSALPVLRDFLTDINTYISLLTAKSINAITFFVNSDASVSGAYIMLDPKQDQYLILYYIPDLDKFDIETYPEDDDLLRAIADYILTQSPYLSKLKPLFRAVTKAKDWWP